MKVPVGVSARHVHLSADDFLKLFGPDVTLEIDHYLSQMPNYASNLCVTIKTEKASINNVRVLGPLRNYTQVEISRTDAYKLGLNPPVRTSGDLVDACDITIEGPYGTIEAKESCILAERHIHMPIKDLEILGLVDGEEVKVKLGTEKVSVLHNVYIKAGEGFSLELHLDTDDANACLVKTGEYAEIKKINN